MKRTSDNPNRTQRQDEFALSVKVALLHRGLSLSELARSMGLSRTTVSLAVNRGLFEPTRQRIAAKLSITL